MDANDLEAGYTLVAEALGRLGPDRAQLFLATLALALISRAPDRSEVERLIEQAERCAAD